VRLATGVVALHVVDDNFLQPNPGMSAGDHLVGGSIQLALLVAGAAAYSRVRAGARGAIALLLGFFGLLVSTEAVYYASEGKLSGDDYTGLLAIPAGLTLLGVGVVTLWRSRRTNDRLPWRYARRGLIAAAVVVMIPFVWSSLAVSYVVTHAARAYVPEANLGAAYENVEFETSDGLRLKGWYIPSKNGAAVISFPGRAGSQKPAKMLARHGYGVLLFDRRGEGESEGDPNIFGWQGERDIHAAVDYLQTRSDVDPERIGGIGLSVGGEMMIEAAAESDDLKAIVSEGGSSRSVLDLLANPGMPWQTVAGNLVATPATAIFTSDLPPRTLKSLVPKIDAATFFVYGEKGQPIEKPANDEFYRVADGTKELWEVPGGGHAAGADAQPAEYERRIVAFFDRNLGERS
jgi:dienelactone hydrolase